MAGDTETLSSFGLDLKGLSEDVQESYKKRQWLDNGQLDDCLKRFESNSVHVLDSCVGLHTEASRKEQLEETVLQEKFKDMQNGNKYFIPYHPHGNHWVVFVVEPHESESTIACFDPFGGSSGYKDENNKAMDLLSRLLGGSRKCNKLFYKKQEQRDVWSCGYWCLRFIKWAVKQDNVYGAVREENKAYSEEKGSEAEDSREKRLKEVKSLKEVGEIAFAVASISLAEKAKGDDKNFNKASSSGKEEKSSSESSSKEKKSSIESQVYNDALKSAKEIMESGISKELISRISRELTSGISKELIGDKEDTWEELIKEQYRRLSEYRPSPSSSPNKQSLS
jgi:hypothetical protein